MKREAILLISLLTLTLSSPLPAGATPLPEGSQGLCTGDDPASACVLVDQGNALGALLLRAPGVDDDSTLRDVCVGALGEGCGMGLAGSAAYTLGGGCWQGDHDLRSFGAPSHVPLPEPVRSHSLGSCSWPLDGEAFPVTATCSARGEAVSSSQTDVQALGACSWDSAGVPWLGGTEVPGPVREVPRVVGEEITRHGHFGGLVALPSCDPPCPPKPYTPPGPTAGDWGCDRFSTVCVYPDHTSVLPANGSNTWCRTGKPGILEPTQWTATGMSAGLYFTATWIMEVPQYGGAPDKRVSGSTVFYETTEPGIYQTLEPFPPAGAFMLGTTFPDCRRLLVDAPQLSGTVGVWLVYGQ